MNNATVVAEFCRACGEELIPGARFCEACGQETEAPPTSTTPASATGCARCGAEVGEDGYCTSCGLKAAEAIAVEDHGRQAYATHRGRRHPRNEDAAALALTSEGWPVLAVADGVSASPNPHLAAAAAVAAGVGELGDQPFTGPEDLVRAVTAAHQAACDVPADGDPHWPADGTHPACTIVVAVATAETIHVANIGDARAYRLMATADPAGNTADDTAVDPADLAAADPADHGAADPAGASAADPAEVPTADPADPRVPGVGDSSTDVAGGGWAAIQLTTDDSMAALAVREGVEPSVALTLPDGHAVTAWLGADAPDPAAHVASRPALPGDLLLVCSDGLWNYAPTDEALTSLANATLPPSAEPIGSLAKVCEQLVSWANDQGGSDNICVALTPVGPGEGEAAAVAAETDAPGDAEQTDEEEPS